jgi:hypothetical protein
MNVMQDDLLSRRASGFPPISLTQRQRELLHAAGITTWAELEASPAPRLHEIKGIGKQTVKSIRWQFRSRRMQQHREEMQHRAYERAEERYWRWWENATPQEREARMRSLSQH